MLTDSKQRLAGDIRSLLDAIRRMGDGEWACLFEASGILFAAREAEMETGAEQALRELVAARAPALLALPQAMAGAGPEEDVFADHEEHEFLLAVVNGRLGLLVACPDAEALRAEADRPLTTLVDRVFRWDGRFRIAEGGRGFFFGRPRLDVVVVK